MKKQKIMWIVAMILVILLIVGVGYGIYKAKTQVVQNPIVTMEIEGYGVVKMELYPNMAPNTVAHFVKKINEGYYNGLTFHRTIPDFMIQGGDKAGTGSGTLDYALPGEFIANQYTKNTLKHERDLGENWEKAEEERRKRVRDMVKNYSITDFSKLFSYLLSGCCPTGKNRPQKRLRRPFPFGIIYVGFPGIPLFSPIGSRHPPFLPIQSRKKTTIFTRISRETNDFTSLIE